MPTLVDTNLKRERVISWIAGLAQKHGEFGTIAITPSTAQADDWKRYGGIVTNIKNLDDSILKLGTKIKQGDARQPIVFVNQYDGIDLPDSMCRILCLDSLPSYSSLADRYYQEMRPASSDLRRQMAQRVEQGMGRGIRSSSDWCIVVVTGNNLTDFLSEDSKRVFLSKEAQAQIRIAEELAKEMLSEGGGQVAIDKLVNQCLQRNEGWKEYYKAKMNEIESETPRKEYLDRAVSERQAELLFHRSLNHKAVEELESLINTADPSDKGWYLQLKATYLYPTEPAISIDAQIKAYSENQRLFRPEKGVVYSKHVKASVSQPSQITDWMNGFQSHSVVIVHLMSVLEKMTFHSASELFEAGIDELGKAIGLPTERPELTIKVGPDNLWQLTDKTYLSLECKNEVDLKRKYISKTESGQMANHIAWFKENYPGCASINTFVHPANVWAKDAYMTDPCWSLKPDALERLKENTLKFYNSLKDTPLDKLTTEGVKQRLIDNHLNADDFVQSYLRRVAKV